MRRPSTHDTASSPRNTILRERGRRRILSALAVHIFACTEWKARGAINSLAAPCRCGTRIAARRNSSRERHGSCDSSIRSSSSKTLFIYYLPVRSYLVLLLPNLHQSNYPSLLLRSNRRALLLHISRRVLLPTFLNLLLSQVALAPLPRASRLEPKARPPSKRARRLSLPAQPRSALEWPASSSPRLPLFCIEEPLTW